MKEMTLRAPSTIAFVITLLFALTSTSTSLLLAATSCDDDPNVVPTFAVLVSTPDAPTRMWNITMHELERPGPLDLGDSVQIPLLRHWTAARNPDGSVDAYDPSRDCILHFSCNNGGCPSIDTSHATAVKIEHVLQPSGRLPDTGTNNDLTITMPTPH
jgi:hypothetical protein